MAWGAQAQIAVEQENGASKGPGGNPKVDRRSTTGSNFMRSLPEGEDSRSSRQLSRDRPGFLGGSLQRHSMGFSRGHSRGHGKGHCLYRCTALPLHHSYNGSEHPLAERMQHAACAKPADCNVQVSSKSSSSASRTDMRQESSSHSMHSCKDHSGRNHSLHSRRHSCGVHSMRSRQSRHSSRVHGRHSAGAGCHSRQEQSTHCSSDGSSVCYDDQRLQANQQPVSGTSRSFSRMNRCPSVNLGGFTQVRTLVSCKAAMTGLRRHQCVPKGFLPVVGRQPSHRTLTHPSFSVLRVWC